MKSSDAWRVTTAAERRSSDCTLFSEYEVSLNADGHNYFAGFLRIHTYVIERY
jgi:hypothetical protein